MIRHALLSLGLVACVAASQAEADCTPSAEALSDATRELASDHFGGRAPSSSEEPLVMDFITNAFRDAGLEPAGDMVGGKRLWTQEVALVRSGLAGSARLAFNVGQTTLPLEQGVDISIRPSRPGVDAVDIRNAPIVFVGYGISAPETDWSDFKGLDLTGKIALILVNDPDYDAETGPFGGKTMTYYGRWTYKFEEAARQGALGAIIVHEQKAASYGWPTVSNSNMADVFDIAPPPGTKKLTLKGWVPHDMAVKLVSAAGLDLGALEQAATQRGFKPIELKGVSLDANYGIRHEKTLSHNVLAIKKGAKRPDEYVLYSAHWDHIGKRTAPDGTVEIYHGAMDNAVGVATLLEIAKCFGGADAPDRSVVFLATTAEEQGMLGASYYAENPLYPLGATLGLINMDLMGLFGKSRNVSSFGIAANSLTEDLKAATERQGRYFSPDPKPGSGNFYRSETLPFARAGIPGITFASGLDLVDGGVAAAQEKMADFVSHRYHQPGDTWRPELKFDGVAEDVALLYDMGLRLANGAAKPYWYKGSEFGNGHE